MKAGLRTFGAVVTVAGAVVLFCIVTVLGAQRVFATDTYSSTSDMNCTVSLETAAGSAVNQRFLCYFDISHNTYHSGLAGSDVAMGSYSATTQRLWPVFFGAATCVKGSSPTIEFGPQAAGANATGLPLVAGSFAFMTSASGSACASMRTALLAGNATGWSGSATGGWGAYMQLAGSSSAACTSGADACKMWDTDASTTVPTGRAVDGTGGVWPSWSSIDFFPGGSVAGTPPVYFCGAVVTVTSHSSGELLSDGEAVTFSVAWTAGRTRSVSLGWPDDSTSYPSSLLVGGELDNPHVVTLRARIPPSFPPRARRVSDIRLRCVDDATENQWTLTVATPVASATDGRQRACMSARLSWPAFREVSTGDVVNWSLDFYGLTPAGDLTVNVQSAQLPVSTDPVPPLSSLTWTTVATAVALGTYGQVIAVTASHNGDLSQFVFRCVDASGVRYGNEFTAGGSIIVPQPEESCYSRASITANPSTWFGALPRLLGCVAYDVFVPSEERLAAFQSSLGDSVELAPFGWGVQAWALVKEEVNTVPTAVTAHTDDCLELVPQGPTIPGAAGPLWAGRDGCLMGEDSPYANAGTQAQIANIRHWAGIGLYVFAFFGFTRRTAALLGMGTTAGNRANGDDDQADDKPDTVWGR